MNFTDQIKPALAAAFLFIVFTGQVFAATPSDVYQRSEMVIADIDSIRNSAGISEKAREPGVQIAKTPLHVYTKIIELDEKIQRFKAKNNWPEKQGPTLPTSKVTPKQPMEALGHVLEELAEIKQKMGITASNSVPLVKGKTPSDVYESVWYASYKMDALIGALNPSYVYRNTLRITDGLLVLAKNLNKNVTLPEAKTLKGNSPADANIEAFKILYKIAKIERNIGIKPSRVPSFPAGNISPSDVYDATNNIIAELTKINISKKLPRIKQEQVTSRKITPNDVVAQMLIIHSLLDQIDS